MSVIEKAKQIAKPLAKRTLTSKIRVTGAAAGTAVGTGVAGAIGSAVTTTTVVGMHVPLGVPAVFAAFAATPISIATAPAWVPLVTAGLITAGGLTGLAIGTKAAKKVSQWLDNV